jgi:hypothetical protein
VLNDVLSAVDSAPERDVRDEAPEITGPRLINFLAILKFPLPPDLYARLPTRTPRISQRFSFTPCATILIPVTHGRACTRKSDPVASCGASVFGSVRRSNTAW